MSRLREQVAEFHRAMGIADRMRDVPTVPPDDVVRFRARLIAEEFFETIKAMFPRAAFLSKAEQMVGSVIERGNVTVDLPELVDGLADLDYVVEGTRLAFGVDGDPVSDEVHRTNMAKADGPLREDGKRMKPPGWTPPDIARELRLQGWKGGES